MTRFLWHAVIKIIAFVIQSVSLSVKSKSVSRSVCQSAGEPGRQQISLSVSHSTSR